MDIKETLQSYSQASETLSAYTKQHADIITKHFELEESERVAKFTLEELINGMVEDNTLTDDITLESGDIVLKYKHNKNRVIIYNKKNYNDKE